MEFSRSVNRTLAFFALLAFLPGLICILPQYELTRLASIPVNIQVEQDDNNVRLTWGGPIKPDNLNPAGVSGYKIVWGPLSNPTANTALTENRAIQLQPLTNGQPYVATIQAVDSYGNFSSPTAPINFTGDASRVNNLRNQMTGFFDDFDTPQGALDELKWNQAVSKCVDPTMTTSFINNQFHAHNMTVSGFCDRSQVVNRIRTPLDFTGRTATISFDMDGAVSRNIWYLDLLDASTAGQLDITSHVDFFDSSDGHPGNELRISQNGNSVHIGRVDNSGKEGTIANNEDLSWMGLPVIPNYRRHWIIKLNTTSVNISIDDKVVLTKDFSSDPLSFSKAILQWNFFSYNTAKDNAPYALLHWDNFGFDGPSSIIETHNYRTAQTNSRDYLEANSQQSPSTTINIPDNLAGARAQRLMFTIQPGGYQTYNWNPDDKVIVNGSEIPISQIKPVAGGIDTIRPYAVSLPLPEGLLHTGSNTIQFVSSFLPVLNIHAEFDFLKDKAPVFTQPNAIYPETAKQTDAMLMDVGPTVFVNKLGKQDATQGGRYSTTTLPVNGTVKLDFRVTNDLAMNSIGKNSGISKIQVRLDKQVIMEWDFTQPVPASSPDYNFDTTKYANGAHQLDVLAFSSTGAESIPNYFESFGKAGDYKPININIEN